MLPSPSVDHVKVRCTMVQFDYRLLIMILGNDTNIIEFLAVDDPDSGWFTIPGINADYIMGEVLFTTLNMNQLAPEGEVAVLNFNKEEFYLMDKRGNWRTEPSVGEGINFASAALVDAGFFTDKKESSSCKLV